MNQTVRTLHAIILALTLTNLISLFVAWQMATTRTANLPGTSAPAVPLGGASPNTGPSPNEGGSTALRPVQTELAENWPTQRLLRGLLEADLGVTPAQGAIIVPMLRDMQPKWEQQRKAMDAVVARFRHVLTGRQWEALLDRRKQNLVGDKMSQSSYGAAAQPYVDRLIQTALRLADEQADRGVKGAPSGELADNARVPGQGLGADELLVGWVQIHQGHDYATTAEQAKALRADLVTLGEMAREEMAARQTIASSLDERQAGLLLEWVVRTKLEDWPKPVTPGEVLSVMENRAAGAR